MTEDLSSQIKSFLINLKYEFERILIKMRKIDQKQKSSFLIEIEKSLKKNKNKIQEVITVLNTFNI